MYRIACCIYLNVVHGVRRGLLDDSDARIAYYTSAFLLKRMMREEPDAYQHMLHNLVFKAQQVSASFPYVSDVISELKAHNLTKVAFVAVNRATTRSCWKTLICKCWASYSYPANWGALFDSLLRGCKILKSGSHTF